MDPVRPLTHVWPQRFRLPPSLLFFPSGIIWAFTRMSGEHTIIVVLISANWRIIVGVFSAHSIGGNSHGPHVCHDLPGLPSLSWPPALPPSPSRLVPPCSICCSRRRAPLWRALIPCALQNAGLHLFFPLVRLLVFVWNFSFFCAERCHGECLFLC